MREDAGCRTDCRSDFEGAGAGEIDSSKVRVGVFAEVVYGKGARDPVSGDWEKLGRVSGYIKAVDAESLTLALRQGFGKKRIALRVFKSCFSQSPAVTRTGLERRQI